MLSMIAPLVLVLGLQQATPDPAGPYRAVLEQVRERYPERQVVLTTTLGRPSCAPHCEEGNFARAIAPELISKLKDQGLIVGTCTPEPLSVGCPEGSEGWREDRITVTLGPVEASGEDRATMDVVLNWKQASGRRAIINTQGYRYELRRTGGEVCRWSVVSSMWTWTI